MSKIPNDVERLMWLVADNRDPKAIADFEARFPDLRYELSKRISMVSGLKHAGRVAPSHEIPRFVPKYAPPRPLFNRTVFAVAAVVLAAVSFGTYAVTSFSVAVPKPAPAPIVNVAPPVIPDPKIEVRSPSGTGGSQNQSPANPYSSPDPGSTQLLASDPAQKPITVKGTLPLVAAIEQVCQQAGIHAEIAPGLAQVESEIDFQGVGAGEALATLGQKYGFTVVPQERGTVLIIPVRPNPQEGAGQPSTSPSTASGPLASPVTSGAPDKR